SGVDWGYGIAVDGSGAGYVAGQTVSSSFPTLNPYQGTYQGGGDAFVAKLSEGPPYICGDADASREVDVDDAVYLIAYIFSGGPEPVPYESGDADCSGDVDIDDVVWLISYIFSGGNEPCDTDGDGEPDC
ncbi:MAG: hypothetical protein KAT85_01765, partial [candidate division Zixibacteria bacterium]|nr:hypothetical protein [candidate division Zixibacteria bacterium]